MDSIGKLCLKCCEVYPKTTDFFYRYAPKRNHPNGGFQPYCKSCWKMINRENKIKMKHKKAVLTVVG